MRSEKQQDQRRGVVKEPGLIKPVSKAPVGVYQVPF